jgi:hypothetical protein
MQTSLDTTNFLLGIMAAVSILEALLLIAAGIAGWKAYTAVMALVKDIETRHVAPTTARVNDVLSDLKVVTATWKAETERMDHAIHRTIDRVDDTARRMRSNVVAKTSRVVGFMRGVRVALETLLAYQYAGEHVRR